MLSKRTPSTRDYSTFPIENLLNGRSNYNFKSTGIKAMPVPLKHRNAVNPQLKTDIQDYCHKRELKIEKCFLDHELTADNIQQVVTRLNEEILDIQKAMCASNMGLALEQLEDLDIKSSCLTILAQNYTYKIFPV